MSAAWAMEKTAAAAAITRSAHWGGRAAGGSARRCAEHAIPLDVSSQLALGRVAGVTRGSGGNLQSGRPPLRNQLLAEIPYASATAAIRIDFALLPSPRLGTNIRVAHVAATIRDCRAAAHTCTDALGPHIADTIQALARAAAGGARRLVHALAAHALLALAATGRAVRHGNALALDARGAGPAATAALFLLALPGFGNREAGKPTHRRKEGRERRAPRSGEGSQQIIKLTAVHGKHTPVVRQRTPEIQLR